MGSKINLVARIGSFVLSVGLGVGLAACGGTSSPGTTRISSPAATNTPATSALAATATATTDTSDDPCATTDADTTTLLSQAQIPLPTNTGVVTPGGGTGASMNFTVVNACAHGSTPAQVQAFYAAQMPTEGWTTATVKPPCDGSPCWSRVASQAGPTTLGVTLENVQTASTGDTTFTLYIVREHN